MTMGLGDRARLTIAGHKGYGPNGFPAWGYPFVCHTWHAAQIQQHYYIFGIGFQKLYSLGINTLVVLLSSIFIDTKLTKYSTCSMLLALVYYLQPVHNLAVNIRVLGCKNMVFVSYGVCSVQYMTHLLLVNCLLSFTMYLQSLSLNFCHDHSKCDPHL